MAAPMSDVKNVKLGVCRVLFDGVDLGYTKGGVTVTVATETHKVNVDQFGQTAINEYITGRTVTAKVPLAETTLENLVAVMPGAILVTDSTTPTKKRVDVPTGVGLNLLDFAKPLVLHPIALPDANKSEDFVIPRAATAGALEFGYDLENERLYSCEFNGYPDANNKLFTVGDTTVVPKVI